MLISFLQTMMRQDWLSWIQKLVDDFQIKDLRTLKYLDMEFARSKSSIFVNQRKYILNLLQETSLLGCKVSETSIEQNLKLEAAIKNKIKEREKYQRLVGRLIYLSHTHLDLLLQLVW